MAEIGDFGAILLAIAGGVMLALVARTVSERFPIPAPALFLVAAAATPVLLPDIRTVERIGVVALIVILFDGGMIIGLRRFRRAAMPIASLGILGTVLTAAVMAVLAHYLFDFTWTTAWILGAALAPTDPAVMFSILGDKVIRGRTGTILEGEAGVNDPVGIALLIGMLEFATERSRRQGSSTGRPPSRTAPASWPSSSQDSRSATSTFRTNGRSGASTLRWRASPRSSCSWPWA
jgi:potassium/hydrogen antiporter